MLRNATGKDLEALAELELLLFPENCLNERSLREELGTSRAFLWGKPMVGYCIVRFGPELIDILRVGVHPDFQGRGIGERMLRELLEEAHLPTMLTVRKDNIRARRLYSKLGFRSVAMLPQVKSLMMLRPFTSDAT